jgi:hypothetical protein
LRFAVALSLLLAACGGATPAVTSTVTATTVSATPTTSPTLRPTAAPTPMSGDAFAALLAKSGIATGDVVVYTAETDTNHLLGRPGQYIGKVNWTDVRASSRKQEATVEIFGDDASLQARYTYLDGIFKSSPLFLQYMFRNETRRLILRVPKELTPTQASEYESWLKTL